MDAPGRIGRYKLLKLIGRGRLGEMYLGEDTVLGREVAVKLMAAAFRRDERIKERFFLEARSAARLQHPNIVTVFEFGEHDEAPYIVMEFLRGESLATRMGREPRATVGDTLAIGVQLCAGLEFAHQNGVIHRDIRPANVWICHDGTVKLLDFGLAKAASSTGALAEPDHSDGYVSPEQVAGRPVDRRSDVFSAGAVLYALLCGDPPFGGGSPSAAESAVATEAPAALPAGVPPELSEALRRALEKHPDRRYASAGDFGADLESAALALRLLGDATLLLTVAAKRPVIEVVPPSPEPSPPKTRASWSMPPWPGPGVQRRLVAVCGVSVLLLVGYAAWHKPAEVPKPVDGRRANVPDSGSLPAPARRIRITSTPAGATVRIEGRSAGMTPAQVELKAEDRRAHISRDGYLAVDVDISPANVAKGVLAVTLSPQKPLPQVLLPQNTERLITLSASGSYPFEVVEGVKVRSAASDHHELRVAATSRVRLYSDKVFLDRQVTLDPGKDRVSVNVPRLGSILVAATGRLERCLVMIDDIVADGVPLRRPIASGSHRVRMRCDQGDTAPVSVTIVENEETPVSFRANTELIAR